MIVSAAARIRAYTTAGWWSHETLYAAFARRCAGRPDDEAVIDPLNRDQLLGDVPQRLTYAQLLAAVERFAAGFAALGVAADDVVVTQLPNTWECIALLLAAAKSGVILSPIPMQYRAREQQFVTQGTAARLLITVGTLRGVGHAAYARANLPPSVTVCAFGADLPAAVLPFPAPELAPALEPSHAPLRQPGANDLLTICWTSGTEGRPKGVPRSHNQWWAVALAKPAMAADEVYLAAFPMVAMASIGGQLISWLKYGGKMVLHHPFDAALYLRQLRDEGATYASLPPTLLYRILGDDSLLAQADLSSLRGFGSGSAPLSVDLVRRFEARFGIALTNNFGSNEGCALFTTPADLGPAGLRAGHFPAATRRPGPGTYGGGPLETRLRDPQSGRDIDAPGIVGELWIRGPTVFDGYWRTPAGDAPAGDAPAGDAAAGNAVNLDAADFDGDGYFRTGDLLELVAAPDGDRLLYRFVGRCKEIIVRGSMKISPAEIEDVLSAHPSLREVACVGVPDPEFGERVAVVCVSADGREVTLDALRQYLLACGLAIHKLPERIAVLDVLPRNATGKLIRSALREQLDALPPAGR